MVRITICFTHRLVEMKTLVSGRYDGRVSEYTSRTLIKEFDIQVSAVIAKNPNILDDAIPIFLVDTIQ